jgi:hypothetical protein
MIEESPPTAEAGAWQAVTTLRLYAADRVWVVAFALQRRAAGWYVRLVRYPEPNPVARHLTMAGPFPDAARAGARAADLVHRMMVALDQPAGN